MAAVQMDSLLHQVHLMMDAWSTRLVKIHDLVAVGW